MQESPMPDRVKGRFEINKNKRVFFHGDHINLGGVCPENILRYHHNIR